MYYNSIVKYKYTDNAQIIMIRVLTLKVTFSDQLVVLVVVKNILSTSVLHSFFFGISIYGERNENLLLFLLTSLFNYLFSKLT